MNPYLGKGEAALKGQLSHCDDVQICALHEEDLSLRTQVSQEQREMSVKMQEKVLWLQLTALVR